MKLTSLLLCSMLFLTTESNAMEYIRDRFNQTIGVLHEDSNKIILRDRNGRELGRYVKGENKTRDAQYIVIGNGNQLMRLLP